MDETQQPLGETVRKFIENDPTIRKALMGGFVNTRALARMIQSEMSEKPSLEAIVSAIRRYPIEDSYTKYSEIGQLIGKLTMKNKIAGITIENEPGVGLILDRLHEEIGVKSGDILNIVKGIDTVRILVDAKNLDKLLTIIPKKCIKKTNSHLTEIIISLNNTKRKAPDIGIIATLTSKVALNGISLADYLSCDTEMIVVVRERDALRSYETLEKMSQVQNKYK